MKYRLKSYGVEAIQCTMDNNTDIARFLDGECVSHLNADDPIMSLWDHAGNFQKVFELDYIVKRADNKIVVMGQDEFESLYEKCENI